MIGSRCSNPALKICLHSF
uniref:Uncharacterized protein n=1 Tax=Anguilla anguilla TaxID=7936 RepID=A0A0E9QBW3_ANGAN